MAKLIVLMLIASMNFKSFATSMQPYPVRQLIQELKTIPLESLTKDEIYTSVRETLLSYRQDIDETTLWRISQDDERILITFPGAGLHAGFFAGPVGDMFNTKHGYSLLTLNFSCNLSASTSTSCSKENWLYDIEFAITIARLLNKKISFLGFSAGGSIAAYAASLYSDEVENLFLIAPAIKPEFMEFGVNLASMACLNQIINRTSTTNNLLKRGFSDSVLNSTCELNKLYNELIDENFYKSITANTYVIKIENDDYVSNEEIDTLKEQIPNLQNSFTYSDDNSHLYFAFLMSDVLSPERSTYDSFVKKFIDYNLKDPIVPTLLDSWLSP